MTPANIVNMAVLAGLSVISISDHNSCRNCVAATNAAKAHENLIVLPAMELTTAEEVHVLCVLPNLEAALELDRYVYSHLPDIKNNTAIWGRQLIIDENGTIIGEENRALSLATPIRLQDSAPLIENYGGVAIPAHIDRPSFSILANLGSYSADMGFKCVEITAACDLTQLLLTQSALRAVNIITNSDAHSLDAIPDAMNSISIPEHNGAPSPESIIQALKTPHQ
jgi:PHP family Zn ribbon phosphoesterase